MITTIVNGIVIDAESIMEIHVSAKRYDFEDDEKPKRRSRRMVEDDTITQIMREIFNMIKKPTNE